MHKNTSNSNKLWHFDQNAVQIQQNSIQKTTSISTNIISDAKRSLLDPSNSQECRFGVRRGCSQHPICPSGTS